MSAGKVVLELMRAAERTRRHNRHQHILWDGEVLQDQLCNLITTTDRIVLSRTIKEHHSLVSTVPSPNN